MNNSEKNMIVLFFFDYAIIVYNYCITRKFFKNIFIKRQLLFKKYKIKLFGVLIIRNTVFIPDRLMSFN